MLFLFSLANLNLLPNKRAYLPSDLKILEFIINYYGG